MSADGTYIEYISTGDGPPVEIPHPPMMDNPHDPIHYYQGVNGRYYYTPNGEPQAAPGQPQMKPPGTPDDLKDPVKPEANPKWKHEAGKGYKMAPEALRALASRLESEFNRLKPILEKVGTKGKIGQDAVGSWGSAEKFTEVSDNALTAFNKYYGELLQTYNDVINRLRTTANNGQKAEQDTHKAVTSTPTGNDGGNKEI